MSDIEINERFDGLSTLLQRYIRDMPDIHGEKSKLLTPEMEVDLIRRLESGDREARSHLITANLRLVITIAKKFQDKGLPLMDLISEGNIGLMKGVDHLKSGKGSRVSTYVGWWIRQGITRALANQAKTLRLPVNVGIKLRKMWRVTKSLELTLWRIPTDEEVSFEMEMTVGELKRLRSYIHNDVSLDQPAGMEDDSSLLHEMIEDESMKSPLDALKESSARDILEKAMERLSERERKVLEFRYGIGGGETETLEMIGKRFGVTRERIRTIQNNGLRKLEIWCRKRSSHRNGERRSEV